MATPDLVAPPEEPSEGPQAPVTDTSKQLGYYIRIDLEPSPADPRRLVFVAAAGSQKAPSDVVSLRSDFQQTARVASILFADEQATRKDIFFQIHKAADRGLRGPNLNVEDGRSNLETVKNAITDAAYSVRRSRLREYGQFALIGIALLLLGIAVHFTNGFGFLPASSSSLPWTLAAFWIPAGAAICVWGEFALRMQTELTYDQLLNMDPARWHPGERVAIVIGISFIFAFILYLDIVKVGVGNLLLNDFAGKAPVVSLVVGGITGLAFTAVRDIIFRIRPETKK